MKMMLEGWPRMVCAIFFFCFFAAHLPSQTRILESQAFDPAGKAVRLKDLLPQKDFLVLLFLGADCPLSQKAVTEAANDISKVDLGGKVGLAGLLVGRDDEHDIRRLREEFKVTFPLLLDRDNQIASRLGVTKVPTALLVDQKGKVLYQGRINDRVEVLGKRSTLRRHDLREAIVDALEGKPVRVASTEAVGCPVEFRKPTPEARGTVEYFRDIQPILYRTCVVCHQKDGVAPFPLTDYDDATFWMETAMDLIRLRRMPPGQGDSEYHISDAVASPSEREQESIRQWLREGMPKGTPPTKPLPLPPIDPGAADLGKPDLVLRQQGPMTVGPVGDDLYRYHVFKLNLERDLKIRAIRMLPGNRKVVHHTLIYNGDSALLAKASADPILQQAELLPGDRGPGFGQSDMLGKYLVPKKGSGIPRAELICGYTPGAGAARTPPGYAITIPKHSDLIVQFHYHRTGKEEVDDSSVALFFAEKDEHPDKSCQVVAINDENFLVMPPNQKKRTRVDWPVEDDCEVVGIQPHGHSLTLSQTFTIIRPDGSMQKLLDVPAFDFNWQKSYTFEKPIRLSKGSFIRVSSHMDNTSENPRNPNKPPRPVYLGEGTTDEMVFPAVFLIVPKNTTWPLTRGAQTIWLGNALIQTLREGFGLEKAGGSNSPAKKTDGDKKP